MIKLRLKDFYPSILIYCTVCAGAALYQKHLMYHPSTEPSVPEGWVKTSNYAMQTVDDHKEVVVIFPGNSGSAKRRIYYKNLIPSKYHIVIAEYPGFGFNSYKELSRVNIIEDARALLKEIIPKYSKVILLGESLGSGIASQMAREFNIQNLVLVTPYTSIKDVAQNKFWFLPVRLFLKDNYDSTYNLKGFRGKTLVVVSEHDTVIPPKFANKLYKGISGPKEKILVQGAAHSNWIGYLTNEQKMQFTGFFN